VSGVRGWVKVHSDTQPRENILSYPTWWLKKSGHWQKTSLVDTQHTAKNVLALIEGISDRDAAEQLRGTDIAIPRAELPATDADEYYWTDLIGCEVFDIAGQRLGPATRVFSTGANDVLVVRDERVLPEEVTLAAQKIVVDWDPDF